MNGETTQCKFGGDADHQNCLFAVNSGIKKIAAIEHASCAINSVKGLLDRAICNNEPVSIGEAWLIREALDAAETLLEACQK